MFGFVPKSWGVGGAPCSNTSRTPLRCSPEKRMSDGIYDSSSKSSLYRRTSFGSRTHSSQKPGTSSLRERRIPAGYLQNPRGRFSRANFAPFLGGGDGSMNPSDRWVFSCNTNQRHQSKTVLRYGFPAAESLPPFAVKNLAATPPLSSTGL